MTEDETRRLVDAAANGGREAIDALFDRYLPGLRAFVRLRAGRMIRARESDSDIVQSVCREVLEHLDRFQYSGEKGFKSWLYSTALRKLSNRARYHGARRRDAARDQAIESRSDAALLAAYRSFATPSRNAAAREEIRRIESAFERLPEDYREVVILAHVVGLSREEIAQQTGRSEGAVRSLLSRALSLLAESLES